MNETKKMQELARYISEHADENLNLTTLSKHVGLSPSHMQKRFKAVIGVSPKEYHSACRTKNLKDNLKKEEPVSSAVYGAGFSSPSRVYEKLSKNFGMTPKQYQKGGADMEISYAAADTKLGKIMIAATDRGICFLQFAKKESDMLADLKEEFPKARLKKINSSQNEHFKNWMKILSLYLDGEKINFDLPLDIRGTAFQLKVWKFLITIPRRKTMSYQEVAKAIGHPKAYRAVATACGSNNVSIIIPCHRVLRGSGDLAGYRWGIENKKKLLQMEQD